MTREEFFAKFELFAELPGAVAKMRGLVLQLAVQGQLYSGARPWSDCSLGEAVRLRRGFDLPVQARVQGVVPIYAANGPVGFHDEARVSGPGVVTGRSGSIGKVHYVRKDFWPLNTALYVEDFCGNDPQYTCLLLRSLHLERFSTSTAVPTLNRNVVHREPVRIPPLDEQQRIVAKVDELMALCDQLEAQQKERETRHAALARASLSRFAAAPTPSNLTLLFHNSYTITPADLRKSILELAVRGRLVPQDCSEVPAAESISRIAATRRTAQRKEYDRIAAEDIPYDIPASWTWVRLGSLALSSDAGWSPQCMSEARSGEAWGVLKVSAVSWGVFKPEENKALPLGMPGRPECEVRAGDFLLSRANTEELVARSVVVESPPPRLMMSDKIVRFTFPSEIDRAFINIANTSRASRSFYARNSSGTSSSMKNVGREVMCNLPLPIPPVAEQGRIVAKVNQLMTFVEAIETRLGTSRAAATKLLDAIVGELTF